VDGFRIKIWSEDASGAQSIVYDNVPGDGTDNATTPIGGGSIIVHVR